MRLSCPSCGATHSADGITADAEARAALMLSAELPGEIGALTLRYIGLFRPASRALAWSRVLSLLQELAPMIKTGVIRRAGRDWPAPVAAWRAAMHEMLERRDKLTLPMKSHGYLLDIIAGDADKVEGAQERQVEQSRQQQGPQRSGPVGGASLGDLLAGGDPTSKAERPEAVVHVRNVRNADVALLHEKGIRKTKFKQDMTEREGIDFLRGAGYSDAVIYEVLEVQKGRTGNA